MLTMTWSSCVCKPNIHDSPAIWKSADATALKPAWPLPCSSAIEVHIPPIQAPVNNWEVYCTSFPFIYCHTYIARLERLTSVILQNFTIMLCCYCYYQLHFSCLQHGGNLNLFPGNCHPSSCWWSMTIVPYTCWKLLPCFSVQCYWVFPAPLLLLVFDQIVSHVSWFLRTSCLMLLLIANDPPIHNGIMERL